MDAQGEGCGNGVGSGDESDGGGEGDGEDSVYIVKGMDGDAGDVVVGVNGVVKVGCVADWLYRNG